MEVAAAEGELKGEPKRRILGFKSIEWSDSKNVCGRTSAGHSKSLAKSFVKSLQRKSR